MIAKSGYPDHIDQEWLCPGGSHWVLADMQLRAARSSDFQCFFTSLVILVSINPSTSLHRGLISSTIGLINTSSSAVSVMDLS
jgi:hypothetical protein